MCIGVTVLQFNVCRGPAADASVLQFTVVIVVVCRNDVTFTLLLLLLLLIMTLFAVSQTMLTVTTNLLSYTFILVSLINNLTRNPHAIASNTPRDAQSVTISN